MAIVTADEFKKVMGSFAAGVTVVTTIDADGARSGLTATAFSSLSLSPPMCLVCIDKRAASHAAIQTSRKFAVSMLSHAQQEISSRFASRVDDKFEGVPHRAGPVTGCPLIDGAVATLECELVAVHPGGDHDIFVGELKSVEIGSDGHPLVYWRGRYGDVTSR
jgi:flavin reductase (DIM6/NTAB) family NADH-FMN oxidoreductase RutF